MSTKQRSVGVAAQRYRTFVYYFPVSQPAYGTSALPSLLARFDWVLSEPAEPGVCFRGHRHRHDPKTVFAVPSAMQTLLKAIADVHLGGMARRRPEEQRLEWWSLESLTFHCRAPWAATGRSVR